MAGLRAAGTPVNTGGGDARVTAVPAALAKGLELDHVVVVEPADIVAGSLPRPLGDTVSG